MGSAAAVFSSETLANDQSYRSASLVETAGPNRASEMTQMLKRRRRRLEGVGAGWGPRPGRRLPISRAALFLDLDGTLTPLQARPSDVTPEPDLTQLLATASDRLGGRLAIVSGREISQVDHILERACRGVAGVHGLERRTAVGELQAIDADPRIAIVADVMAVFAGAQAGLLVERKGRSVALHYRGAPQAEEAMLELADRLAATNDLEVQRGDKVVELKTPGPDKGTAVRAFMNEAPFRGATPIYLGDDLTDEPAFAAARARGGLGILVGTLRPTVARARINCPSAVRAWLRRSLEAMAFDLGDLQWVA